MKKDNVQKVTEEFMTTIKTVLTGYEAGKMDSVQAFHYIELVCQLVSNGLQKKGMYNTLSVKEL